MEEPKIDPKKVIKIEPLMIKEDGGYGWVILIPLIILILTMIL